MGNNNQTVKNILFVAISGRDWIGGLYYINNVLYTLDIDNREDIQATVIVSSKQASLFSEFKMVRVIELSDKHYAIKKLLRIASIRLFKRDCQREVARAAKQYDIDFIYPAIHYPFLGVADKCVGWIPDFQEFHYPEWFTSIEKLYRRTRTSYYAKRMKRLVLSSETARQDLVAIEPTVNAKIGIVHFISNIEARLGKVCDQAFIEQTKQKYHINGRFFIVCNQFWKHKNHQVVFEAINILKKGNKLNDITFVFTGSQRDYRTKGYFRFLIDRNNKSNQTNGCYTEVMTLAENSGFLNRVNCVGLIERDEQLALMHDAIAVIQPSLFEGWGTVVEDAKVLDADIALSDIPIHREQASDQCEFFNPHKADELARLLETMINRPSREKNYKAGLARAKEHARNYAQAFLDLLEEEV